MTSTTIVTVMVAGGSIAALLAMAALVYLGAYAMLAGDPEPAQVVATVLTALAATTPAATACPVCGGRHCAGCEAPARITAAPHRWIARHCEEEIPPSIRVPALLMDPVRRARELRRQLGNGRPALDLRVRAHLAPTAWAARLGRPVQLGMGRAIGGVA